MLTGSDEVAIIGGGISGMSTALCLHELGIPCTIYEKRDSLSGKRTEGGGIIVASNALRVLDRWGIYEKVNEEGFQFKDLYFKNPNEETVEAFPYGDKELYGYAATRLYRQTFIDILYATCQERGIPILFEKKFARIVEETDRGVTFELVDGTTATAQMLIGADGIHSKVRQYITPGANTKYIGLMAIMAEVQLSQLRIPKEKDYVFPVQLTTRHGMFGFIPQNASGDALLFGTQFPTEDRSPEEWASLFKDTKRLKEMLLKDTSLWPDIIQSALEDIREDTLIAWRYELLPGLTPWASQQHGRVLILGDAAHALPPTTGQGVSMALEDIFALGGLIKAARDNADITRASALGFWQHIRHARIRELLGLTKQLNNKRLPLDKQALLPRGELWFDERRENPRQMAWLFEPQIQEKIDVWVKQQQPNQ